MDNSNKSSRLAADYFELLMARFLAEKFQTSDDFSGDMAKIETALRQRSGGENKVAEQKKRAEKAMEKLIEWLADNGIDEVQNIKWVGRVFVKENSVSDVDMVINENQIVGLSLKSSRHGLGTEKNIGLQKLVSYLGIQLDKLLEMMWKNIRSELKVKGFNQIAEMEKTKIKASKYDYPIINTLGTKYGLAVQEEAVKQSVSRFNELEIGEKRKFLSYILGIDLKKRILNVIANQEGIKIFWNDKYDEVVKDNNIVAVRLGAKSYKIMSANKDVVRIQASFTNGIGLSAFCERAFLI